MNKDWHKRLFLYSILLFAFFGLFLPQTGLAGSVQVLVESAPLAGSQYYAFKDLWPHMRVGDRLVLIRETDNRFDKKAVRVEWNGQKLGYVPRKNNHLVSRALDAGEKLEARISRLKESRNPWQRLEFEIYLAL